MSPSSFPRGWLLGLSLWFTSTVLLYVGLSRGQQEQSWQMEQMRQELSALHTVVSACRAEGHAQAGERGRGARRVSQLSPEDVDLVAARVVSWMQRAEKSEPTPSATMTQALRSRP
jgi:hypothetical protein